MKEAIERIGDVAETWAAVVQLLDDTHYVLTARLLGLSGILAMPDGERQTMMSEKLPAFTEAALSGTFTALSGGSPDRIVRDTLEPISSKASANRARLQRRDPPANERDAIPS